MTRAFCTPCAHSASPRWVVFGESAFWGRLVLQVATKGSLVPVCEIAFVGQCRGSASCPPSPRLSAAWWRRRSTRRGRACMTLTIVPLTDGLQKGLLPPPQTQGVQSGVVSRPPLAAKIASRNGTADDGQELAHDRRSQDSPRSRSRGRESAPPAPCWRTTTRSRLGRRQLCRHRRSPRSHAQRRWVFVSVGTSYDYVKDLGAHS